MRLTTVCLEHSEEQDKESLNKRDRDTHVSDRLSEHVLDAHLLQGMREPLYSLFSIEKTVKKQ
jgi:hypothetical protein